MIKYKLTPFILISVYFLSYAIYLLVTLDWNTELGLGGLGPYVLLGLTLLFLFLDFIIQQTLKLSLLQIYMLEMLVVLVFIFTLYI
jgi:hypothetical protein